LHLKKTSLTALLAMSILALLLAFAPSCAAGVRWTADGVGIRTAAANDAYNPQITSDGSGGAIITWSDERSGSKQYAQDIYAQRVLSSGSIAPGWAADGVGIRTAAANSATSPQITSDGSGGAIIAWQDYRSGSNYVDIYAQRVLAGGSIAPGWAADGVGIRSASLNDAANPQVTSDGSGGAIIAWRDYRSGKYDIYALRVLSGGTIAPGWAADGVGIRTAAADSAQNPQIASDGSGGAIITWTDYRSGTKGDIYAQKMLSSGSTAPGWAADGVGIRTAAADSADYPQIAPDGSGGAIITWQDGRSGTKSDLYAQRVLSGGSTAPGWAADGVGIRTAAANNSSEPQITSDGSGGAIITWYDTRRSVSNEDIYAQRVLSSGSTAPGWTADGVGIRTAAASDAYYPQITSDGSGGAIITWEDTRSGKSDIYAQRVTDPAPAISTISPTSACCGDTITVNGKYFGSTRGSSYVSFGSKKATSYTSWTSTKIKVKVPSGCYWTREVAVSMAGGTSSAKTLKIKPHISAISPTSGSVGAYITVGGTGFGSSKSTSSVKFGTKLAYTSSTSWTNVKVKAKVPILSKGKTTITVTTRGGASNSYTFTVK
jgi:IPT/TIG domain